MKIVAFTLCTLLSCTGIASQAHAAETPAVVAARLAANPPANLDDYFALNAALGTAGLSEARKASVLLAFVQSGMKLESGRAYPSCIFPAWSQQVWAGLDLAASVPDRAAWRKARGQIDKALAARTKAFDRIMAGEVPPAPYTAMAASAKAAVEAKDLRVREYALRVAKDQFARLSIMVLERQELWAAGVEPQARAYLVAATGACAEDRANTEWLKRDLRANGWPKIGDLGEATDRRAWLLVQHADHDPAFQREVLTMLEALLAARETSPRNYAMLYDRVATADERPQRYGTQGVCAGANTWTPYPVEDPASLDRRRADLTLEPMAEYATAAGTFCP